MTSMSRIPIIMQLCIAKSLRVFISRLCMVSRQICFAVKTTRAGKCFAYCLSNRLYELNIKLLCGFGEYFSALLENVLE